MPVMGDLIIIYCWIYYLNCRVAPTNFLLKQLILKNKVIANVFQIISLA